MRRTTQLNGLDLKYRRLGATHPFGLIRQRDLADVMGITRSRISQIETAVALDSVTVERYLLALDRALLDRSAL